MNACPSARRSSFELLARALFHFLPLASPLSASLFLSRARLGVSESRNRGRVRRGVVAVMNASWGNGVLLIVQRVVPSLRLSRPFFSFVLPLSAASFYLSIFLSLSLFSAPPLPLSHSLILSSSFASPPASPYRV